MKRTDGREEVSQSEAARRLGMTPQSLGRWAKMPGAPVVLRRGKPFCVWPDFPSWRDGERERRIREEAAPVDTEQAKARKALADAKLAEYELAQAEGRLVTVEDYRKALADVLDAIRAGMLSVPSKWAPMLVGKRSISEVQGVLERLVGQALGDWSVDAS